MRSTPGVDQALADALARSGDDVDDAFRHARLDEEAGHMEGGKRRHLVRLEDDGVAGDHRRCDLPRDERRGIVPRDDADDDADRQALDPDLLVGDVGGENLALDAAGEFGEVAEELGGSPDLAARLADRLPLFLDDDAGELFGVAADEIGDPPHHLRPVERGERPPGGLRDARRGERPVHASRRRLGYRGDRLAGRR